MWFITFVVITSVLFWLARQIPKNPEGQNGGMKWIRPVAMAATVTPLLLTLVLNCILIVPAGHVATGVLFGTVAERPFTQGFHIVNPLLSFRKQSVRRQVVSFTSAGGAAEAENNVIALSSNNVPIDIDVTYPFRLNPQYAWWVYKNIGDENVYIDQLIKTAARNATRDATSDYTDVEATTSRREDLAISMGDRFKNLLKNYLVKK